MLKLSGYIDLPENIKPGGFDHADVHRAGKRLYVAHTVNDALDVIDCLTDHYLYSIPNLTGVAGALVSNERNLVFTSNRGENTVGIFSPSEEGDLVKVSVGVRPNGLAFASASAFLLVANVGDPAIPGSFTLSLVDIQKKTMIHSIQVPGRTRWAVFDARSGCFYVNIMDPAQIVVVAVSDPSHLVKVFEIPEAGPPDVVFFNPALQRLYVAVGDPGVIDVFDTRRMQPVETVQTENGAHTLALDVTNNKIYAFLPQTHRAGVFMDITV
jgi:DNA-binding beta-propeller fold protein YncE